MESQVKWEKFIIQVSKYIRAFDKSANSKYGLHVIELVVKSAQCLAIGKKLSQKIFIFETVSDSEAIFKAYISKETIPDKYSFAFSKIVPKVKQERIDYS